jgi:hypothetical protein
VKVLSWYDNEWGFTREAVRVALKLLAAHQAPQLNSEDLEGCGAIPNTVIIAKTLRGPVKAGHI